jgi:hypothetical protein
MFKKRQAKEEKDKQKEREKIRIKLEAANFPPQLVDNPVSARDKMIKEVWYELKGLTLPESERPVTGPVEIRIEELRKKLKAFEEKAKRLASQARQKADTIIEGGSPQSIQEDPKPL